MATPPWACALDASPGELDISDETLTFTPTTDGKPVSLALKDVSRLNKAQSLGVLDNAIRVWVYSRVIDDHELLFTAFVARDATFETILQRWRSATSAEAASVDASSASPPVEPEHEPDPPPPPPPPPPEPAAAVAAAAPAARAPAPTSASVSAATEKLLSALQTATERLIRYATRGTGKQLEPPLSEALSEVEAVCVALEGVLAHGFKTRQFLLFTVHPWAFVEHSEKFGELNAEAVASARAVGSSDAARLRAWLYLQLNRRCLQAGGRAHAPPSPRPTSHPPRLHSCSARQF